MNLFTCCCKWSFVTGRKRVFGPIYEVGLPGHFTGPDGCHHVGRMMTREEFGDWYADCAACHDGAHRHGAGIVTLPSGHTSTCTCPDKGALPLTPPAVSCRQQG